MHAFIHSHSRRIENHSRRSTWSCAIAFFVKTVQPWIRTVFIFMSETKHLFDYFFVITQFDLLLMHLETSRPQS